MKYPEQENSQTESKLWVTGGWGEGERKELLLKSCRISVWDNGKVSEIDKWQWLHNTECNNATVYT